MAAPSRRAPKSIALKMTELAIAAPQVVAHRMTRMVIAGGNPTKQDRRECQKMVSEKQSAFSEAWFGMAAAGFRANQSIAAGFFGSLAKGRSPYDLPFAANLSLIQSAANAIVDGGLAPFHRKATANAKRLAKSKRR